MLAEICLFLNDFLPSSATEVIFLSFCFSKHTIPSSSSPILLSLKVTLCLDLTDMI